MAGREKSLREMGRMEKEEEERGEKVPNKLVREI